MSCAFVAGVQSCALPLLNLAWPLTAVQSSTLFRAGYTVLATICASHYIHQPAIGGAKAYQLSVSGPECVCVHAIITFSGRKIGRATCRESVGKCVYDWVVTVSVKKNEREE